MGVNSSFKLIINYSLTRKVEKSSTDGLVIETKGVLPMTSKTLAGSRGGRFAFFFINNCFFSIIQHVCKYINHEPFITVQITVKAFVDPLLLLWDIKWWFILI